MPFELLLRPLQREGLLTREEEVKVAMQRTAMDELGHEPLGVLAQARTCAWWKSARICVCMCIVA